MGMLNYKNAKNTVFLKCNHKDVQRQRRSTKMLTKTKIKEERSKKSFSLGLLQELSMLCGHPRPPAHRRTPLIYVTFTGGQRAAECVRAPHSAGRPDCACSAAGPGAHGRCASLRPPRQRGEVGSAWAASSRFSPFLVPVSFNDAGE